MSENSQPQATNSDAARLDPYLEILKRIISGEYRPGHRLIEAKLAQSFHVSRTRIREALFALEKDRLVERRLNVGARVAKFTPDDVEELYEVRAALECLALRRAIRNIPLSAIVGLERRLWDSLEASNDGARSRQVGMDLELHTLIVSHSGNNLLESYIENIAHLVNSLGLISYYDEDKTRRAGKEHLAILKALQQRDLETAESLLVAHIETSKKNALDLFLQTSRPLRKGALDGG